MANDPEDFAAFVAALPLDYETSLMADNVSTAYYRARRAGWERDALVGDAITALRRGGVGLVVTRLGSLAENSPVRREPSRSIAQHALPLPECRQCGQPFSRRSRVVMGTACPACGEPLVLHQHVTGE